MENRLSFWFMGRPTISMAIFNSVASLLEVMLQCYIMLYLSYPHKSEN